MRKWFWVKFAARKLCKLFRPAISVTWKLLQIVKIRGQPATLRNTKHQSKDLSIFVKTIACFCFHKMSILACLDIITRGMMMLWLNISKEFSADILQWSGLSTMLLASSLPWLALPIINFKSGNAFFSVPPQTLIRRKLINLLYFPTDKYLRELLKPVI